MGLSPSAFAAPREPLFGTDSKAPSTVDAAGLSAFAFNYKHWGSTSEPRWGGGFGLGSGFETRGSILFFGGDTRYTLRVLDGVSLSLDQHVRAGLRLGPVRVETSVDFQSISIDRIEGKFSFGMFSPGTGLALSLELPKGFFVRVAAYEQYVWRWFGPDLMTRAISLDLSRALPRW
ncbi:MAG: hypothetical protein U0165_16955 [Polyangiaceae bacterium]